MEIRKNRLIIEFLISNLKKKKYSLLYSKLKSLKNQLLNIFFFKKKII